MKYHTAFVTIPEFLVHNGRILRDAKACYTLYGKLDNKKKLALFFHGFSSNSELHTWWDKFNFNEVLESYNIICINSLGSSHGTTGPDSIDPVTQKSYLLDFPAINIQDTVNFAVAALQQLHIKHVDLAFGCSLGGMQTLDLFLRYPNISSKYISVAGTPVPYMTKLINLAQARLIDQAAVNGEKQDIVNALGASRFFFRLSCTTEEALEVLNSKRNANSSKQMLDVLEEYFVKDNLQFQTQFSPYSNSLYLKLIANFEISAIPVVASNIKRPKLVLVSMQNDFFTPEKYVNDLFDTMQQKGYNIEIMAFKTKFGHEAWIVDGERFYDFIAKCFAV